MYTRVVRVGKKMISLKQYLQTVVLATDIEKTTEERLKAQEEFLWNLTATMLRTRVRSFDQPSPSEGAVLYANVNRQNEVLSVEHYVLHAMARMSYLFFNMNEERRFAFHLDELSLLLDIGVTELQLQALNELNTVEVDMSIPEPRPQELFDILKAYML